MDRTYTIDELWAAVKRRWKVAALVAGGVFVLAGLVIARIPNEYKARALVMVEPFTPHPDLVVPVINAQSLEEKVKSVRSSVYARGLMATTIEELNLYPTQREKGMDDVLLFGGGIIPEADVPGLQKVGVGRIFPPGASLEEIVRYLNEAVAKRRGQPVG